MDSSENKNEHITLWILEQDRQKNREKVQKQKTLKQANTCHKCKKDYSEAKLVQYFACPHCSSRIDEEAKNSKSRRDRDGHSGESDCHPFRLPWV